MSPPAGHVSVVNLPNAWFILCSSRELKDKPLARTLQGTPLVLFRGEGGTPGALVDRCPHRNVPLSLGRVKGGQLQCGYHGWKFDTGGQCRAIPGFMGEPEARSRCATSYATREQDGFIWVYSTPGAVPTTEPFRFPLLEAGDYTTVRRILRAPGSLHATLENTLDVPHTAYLHGGLFRTEEKRNEIDVVVRRSADRVEAEYIGEPRPSGVVGRLLAPGGGVVQHFDRFLMPSIAQVEYRIGEGSHIIVTSAMTPVSEWDTMVYAVVTFRLPLPRWLLRAVLPVAMPVALHIFNQDVRILKTQTETIRRFGTETYASTEIDVLGPGILRLLRAAEQGKPGAVGDAVHETRLKMKT
ncbi:aromatic ring-hydroxylating dioxygenase subunit alpha [Myxococcus sp. MISCRS1]|jgi:phenylpropionate dioxygenase-like ring-hydroxylating dioxygenase large terminal subunit|uniref:aromatic ring-hydroxylating oxygenase subunit alpha n=1 Tax=Myxococcus TaxID=32 RepID=UPI00114450C5|nr:MULTISPECIES: aromatic ring-hydroxylating dioxygenase subunit alpha [unclassified Myxococcus]MBZ4407615.1 aromatic ring-hydroxylating dioxygenase subunit alpha [Myxococcus sp. XM-1-1-1]MCY0998556.1 aromatic ring-hydroxylating dioxygenase subunit alpha [Myxococcus sp. MISCRS1]BDT31454.1 aromatic ring-hydroxylating dioxygenase subunit alpha [Myxococcus sp. MH1]